MIILVSQTGSVVWSLMSYVEKVTEKKLDLWDRDMASDVKKTRSMRPRYPERRCLSFIKTSRYWWRTDAGVKIVTFRIAANTMAWNRKGRIQLFNI